jgi:hypothetical protein
MDADHDRLAETLEKLRVAMLALETYMAQVRDLMAVAQSLLDRAAPPAPSRRKPAARRKPLA